MEEMFPIPEAGKRLGGISPHTINKWLSTGKLQRTKVGSRTMIRASELERILRDGQKSLAPKRGRE